MSFAGADSNANALRERNSGIFVALASKRRLYRIVSSPMANNAVSYVALISGFIPPLDCWGSWFVKERATAIIMHTPADYPLDKERSSHVRVQHNSIYQRTYIRYILLHEWEEKSLRWYRRTRPRVFPTAMYSLPAEKSVDVTCPNGVPDVGQLEKTVREGR